MNAPTVIIGLIVLAVFVAIVARGIYNRRHGTGGCACNGNCGSCGGCASASGNSSAERKDSKGR